MGTTDVLILDAKTREELVSLRDDLLEEAANQAPQAEEQDAPIINQCGCSDSCSGSCEGDCAGSCDAKCENSCSGNCEGGCTNVLGW